MKGSRRGVEECSANDTETRHRTVAVLAGGIYSRLVV